MSTSPDRWRNSIVRYGEEAPDQLLAHPLNPKVHPRRQQDALAGAIGELGWIAPVIVNETTGHVIDGHARIGIAISRQEESVPVAYVRLTPEQEQLALVTFDPLGALAVADKDNLEALLRDVRTDDAALRGALRDLADDNGIDVSGGIPHQAPEAEIDRAEELREKWDTKPGQLWTIGRHRLLCGDATKAEDVERLMAGAQVDAYITDPPYAITGGGASVAHNTTGDAAFERQFFRSWFAGWLRTWEPHTAPGAALWLTIDWRGAVAIEEAIPGTGWRLAHVGVWVRGGLGMGWALRKVHEHFVLLVQERWQRTATDEPDVWEHKWTPGERQLGHGAEKPLPLILRALTLCGGATVADPFSGSGTTLVAAEQQGRPGYAMEVEPAFVAVALERLSKMGLEPRLADE